MDTRLRLQTIDRFPQSSYFEFLWESAKSAQYNHRVYLIYGTTQNTSVLWLRYSKIYYTSENKNLFTINNSINAYNCIYLTFNLPTS